MNSAAASERAGGFSQACAAAAGESWDAAVVGAGPAGALAARQLALAGLSVVLIDKAKFPRDKVCGCCLSAASLSTLASVGLGTLPDRLEAQHTTTLELAAPRARASLLVKGVALSRAAFDSGLVREAEAAGARFLPRTIATVDAAGRLGLRSPADGRVRTLNTRVIVIADGLAGSALSERPDLAPRVAPGARIGAATILSPSVPGYARGAIHMTVGPRGYVGAVRLEDQRLNIAAALDPGFVRDSRGPGPAIARLLADAEMPSLPQLLEARFHATPTLTRRRSVLEFEDVLILGDAAGYVEPFTGEGIAWALASAVLMVPAVVAKCRPVPSGSAAGSWSREFRRRIAPRQHVCRTLAWTLRRPRLATMAIRILSVAPFVCRPALSRIDLPYATREPAP